MAAAAEPAGDIGVPKKDKFIPELEGLRGLLALWVFIFHALLFSGLRIPFVSDGGEAVMVFVLLSGFVIGRLRMFNPESYLVYLVRRLARLYPAYLIALAFGIGVSDLSSSTYAHLPWNADLLPGWIERHATEQTHFLLLLLSHLTMLHGMLPDEVLPGSSFAFVGPAWSVSLEWQFYLVAPILITLLTSRRFQVLTILVIAVLTIYNRHLYEQFTYIVPSFLPLSLAYFVVGIFSALLFDHLRGIRPDLLIYGVGAAVVALLAVTLTASWWHPVIPFVIWMVVLSASVHTHAPGLETVSRLLTCGPVTFLGRISYGFYILHASVQSCSGAALLALGVHTKIVMCSGLIVLALPATLALAFVSYHAVEMPVMRYAKRLRWSTSRSSSQYLSETPR